uniref:Uncharacterized protein n=1 Tax=Solanum lycopersicum TaxID=4081 RepID=A0A3Q7HK25_SOLLC
MPYKNSSELIAAMFSLVFYFLPCLQAHIFSLLCVPVALFVKKSGGLAFFKG